MSRPAADEPVDTAAVWQALVDDLRVWLRRRVPDPALVEDLLQDVFVRVHRERAGLRDDDRVAAWVFRIARNALVDHWRRRAAAPDRAGTDAPDLDAAMAADDPSEAEQASSVLGRWLLRTIDALPPTYREALVLTEIEGVSQRVAAERLGLSYSGLKSRVQRGRARLRELLLRCCDVQLDRTGRVIDFRSRRGAACCP